MPRLAGEGSERVIAIAIILSQRRVLAKVEVSKKRAALAQWMSVRLTEDGRRGKTGDDAHRLVAEDSDVVSVDATALCAQTMVLTVQEQTVNYRIVEMTLASLVSRVISMPWI